MSRLIDAIPALPICIAQIPSTPPPGLGEWLLNVLYLLGVVPSCSRCGKRSRNAFAATHRSTMTLAKKADAHTVDRLEVNVAGLVSSKEFSTHAEENRLRERGLEEQISKARHDGRQRDNALKLDMQNKFEQLREDFEKLTGKVDEGFKQVDERRANNIGVVHRDLKGPSSSSRRWRRTSRATRNSSPASSKRRSGSSSASPAKTHER
jgi:hypothetical protein